MEAVWQKTLSLEKFLKLFSRIVSAPNEPLSQTRTRRYHQDRATYVFLVDLFVAVGVPQVPENLYLWGRGAVLRNSWDKHRGQGSGVRGQAGIGLGRNSPRSWMVLPLNSVFLKRKKWFSWNTTRTRGSDWTKPRSRGTAEWPSQSPYPKLT